jgi:hypothetical protein
MRPVSEPGRGDVAERARMPKGVTEKQLSLAAGIRKLEPDSD